MIASKDALRSRLLQERRAFTEEKLQSDAAAISQQLIRLWLSNQHMGDLYGYLAVHNEPDIMEVFRELSQRRRVYLPSVRGQQIHFFSWDLDLASLAKGAFGIPEVREPSEPSIPSAYDVLLLPCVGCNIRGYRLGYGGGYYDRYLARLSKQPIKVAICYEQGFDIRFEEDPWDIPVDMVITEQRTHWLSNKPEWGTY